MNLREIPQALDVTLRNPRQGLGLIVWGADGRRPDLDILADVARVTGAPMEVMQIGYRESRLDRRADNPVSTAGGAFQFIDSTWEQHARSVLPLYGLPATMQREELFWQRHDLTYAAAATAELARTNYAELARRFPDRQINAADLYLMHFNADGAMRLMAALARGETAAPATRYYNAMAIGSNSEEFYRADGSPRSAQEFYDMMTGYRAGLDGRRHPLMSREPIAFSPRLDGSTDAFVRDPAAAKQPGGWYPLVRQSVLDRR